jgi:hypothetical protein
MVNLTQYSEQFARRGHEGTSDLSGTAIRNLRKQSTGAQFWMTSMIEIEVDRDLRNGELRRCQYAKR